MRVGRWSVCVCACLCVGGVWDGVRRVFHFAFSLSPPTFPT